MERELLERIRKVKPVAAGAVERWQQYNREKARLLPLARPGERDALYRLLAERLNL